MSLEELNKRIIYRGGRQQQRMIQDKLNTLKKALLYSYQAATAILPDEREFRCLINPDKNKPAYDNKIISIPFKDICLNKPRAGKRSEGQEQIGLKAGDVFTWKENGTHWLVFLQSLDEKAYFRSEIRRCDQEVEIDGKKYWVYLRGPVETDIEWSQKSQIEWNSLNYSMIMYITADDNTKSYFERFKTIKILDPRDNKEKNWQVNGVDPYYGDGIIQVMLKEFFNNSIADAAEKEKEDSRPPHIEPEQGEPYITGKEEISQYSINKYEIHNAENGSWLVKINNIEQDLHCTDDILSLVTEKAPKGDFILIYRRENEEDVIFNGKIVSL